MNANRDGTEKKERGQLGPSPGKQVSSGVGRTVLRPLRVVNVKYACPNTAELKLRLTRILDLLELDRGVLRPLADSEETSTIEVRPSEGGKSPI